MDEAMRQDRELHPGCSYSTQSSSTFKVVAGESMSERLQRVVRHCQDEAPTEIFREKQQESGDSAEGSASPFGGIFAAPQPFLRDLDAVAGAFGGSNADAEDALRELARPFEGLLGNFLSAAGTPFGDLPLAKEAPARPSKDSRQAAKQDEMAMPPKHLVRGKVEEI